MAFAASKKSVSSLPGGGRKRKRFYPTSPSTVTALGRYGNRQPAPGVIDKTTPNPSTVKKLGKGNMNQRDDDQAIYESSVLPLQRP